MPDKFSHHTHTHTFTRNTPAKVTQAPASKFTHCSQGHTCVCACVCVRVCVCLTCPRSFISISTRPILSLLTTTHLLFCLLSLSLRACSVLRGLHPSSCFILSNFFRHRPPRSCPPHSSLRPLLSLSHSLCSRLAVIN